MHEAFLRIRTFWECFTEDNFKMITMYKRTAYSIWLDLLISDIKLKITNKNVSNLMQYLICTGVQHKYLF